MTRLTVWLVLVSAGTVASAEPAARPVALPGAKGAVGLDYLAFDRAAGRLWVPAGDTGSVDVFDPATGTVTRVQGFPTAERERNGQKRTVGPSSATIGDDVVYAGNRANSEVCAIDKKTLTRGKCLTMPSPPDGIQYVGSTKELWVTTPRQSSLSILDGGLKGPPVTIAVGGSPEGYAVDEAHGFFYTNLEDGNRTLRINIASRKIVATWKPDCGKDGPRGVAVDSQRDLVFVACTDHVVVLDAAHDGAILAKADTGASVDNIDYLPSKKQLFVGSGAAAHLMIFNVGDRGALTVAATIATAKGARTVVADANGGAYLINPSGGGILVYSAK